MSNATSNAREKIEALLDANSFVEVGSQITARNTDFNMTEKKAPSDGVITGYGTIDDRLVYVYSQDASVLGGTVGEMHAKKICRLYEWAMKMGAPIIGLIDSAGLRLQEATDALHGFGQIYMAQMKASGVIPQIAAVFGTAGGGMAVVPAFCDFTFMERGAKLFVNAPNTLDGNITSACDTSGAAYHEKETDLVDVFGDKEELLSKIRLLVTLLPSNNEDEACGDALDDLNRSVADIEESIGDGAALLTRISDDHVYYECKESYAPDMVTAFIRLGGQTIGAVANRDTDAGVGTSVLGAKGAAKAADFISFCDAFGIPLLSVTNVGGFEATLSSEKCLAKAVARLAYAFANATVPKVNLITGCAFGTAYLAMNSKSVGADMVYAWPGAQIGMMDAGMAAKLMYEDGDATLISEKAAEYAALQNSVESAARRGYVDGIIEPEDTRKYLIGSFEMLYTKREHRPKKKHGTV